MLRIALGPTSPYTVTDNLMRAAAKLARSHTGVRLHTHIAENVVRHPFTACLCADEFAVSAVNELCC